MISRDPTNLWRRHRRREWLKNALAFGVVAGAVGAVAAWDKFGDAIKGWVWRSTVTHRAAVEGRPTLSGTAISASHVQVIDGDTIRIDGRTYRLVGFDTPERGRGARCERERALAESATNYLAQLLTRGAHLQPVPCACPPATQGTEACNYGRLCGVLTISGQDVSSLMIRAGLARAYRCYQTSCPPRQPWC